LPEFSVYGTKFDVTRDGFSFRNGAWNNATTEYDSNGKPIRKNTIAKIGDVIAAYLTPEGQEDFWNSVGYDNKYESKHWWSPDDHAFHKSEGLCYGMALSSAANFNWKNSTDSWGMRSSFKQEEWKKDVESHWDRISLSAFPPYKPFDQNTYDYAPDFQAMEKIMYYFVAQPYYVRFTNDLLSWVGHDSYCWAYIKGKEKAYCWTYTNFDYGFNEVINKIKDVLKQGYVTKLGMGFQYTSGKIAGKSAGGHAVTLVGLIEIGNEKKFVVYDNNFPDELWDLSLNTSDFGDRKPDCFYRAYSDGQEKKVCYRTKDGIYFDIVEIDTLKNEPLYAIPPKIESKADETRSTQPAPEKENHYISYPFQNHIKVYVVGGTFVDVKLTDGKDVLLYPLSAELKKGIAYRGEFNSFKNILLLPADKKYKVTVKKSGTFPFLKVFATIPYDNGTVEYVVYDHAEISENGTTYATFTVGRNNNDKNMYREDSAKRAASPFAPTVVKTYETILPSPSALEGIVLQNGVKLSWKNPQHPNFKEVVVVRKENEIPTSIDNGTEVYRGSDETVTDIPPDMNKVYCYSVFAVGKDGDITEPISVCIDTYKYTLYGHVTDENGNPVSGALVKLYNKDKSKLINMTSTDDKGLFMFNELLDGSYVLTFEHPFYTFDDNETNVTLQNGSREVEVKATGKPAIFMDLPQEVGTGNKQRIIWNGVHVKSDDSVSIKLLINNNWYPIAGQLPFSKHYYDWNVSIPAKAIRVDNNNATAKVATLRIELDSDPSVYAEREIVITRSSENTSSNGSSTTTQQPENTTNEASNPPHSENSVGCSIVPQTSFSSGILNFLLMGSGLIGLIGYRRKNTKFSGRIGKAYPSGS